MIIIISPKNSFIGKFAPIQKIREVRWLIITGTLVSVAWSNYESASPLWMGCCCTTGTHIHCRPLSIWPKIQKISKQGQMAWEFPRKVSRKSRNCGILKSEPLNCKFQNFWEESHMAWKFLVRNFQKHLVHLAQLSYFFQKLLYNATQSKIPPSLCLRLKDCQASAHLPFYSNKWLEVFLLLPGWDASPIMSYKIMYTTLFNLCYPFKYTWVARGTVRVKCLVQADPSPKPGLHRNFITNFKEKNYLGLVQLHFL